MAEKDYPRPDFERVGLQWQSLNGPWDFIFDDDDVGLSQQWQTKPLPQEVQVKTATASDAWEGSDAHTITQKIAAMPENLSKNNAFISKGVLQNSLQTIQVPYVYQTAASGINDRSAHQVLWYQRDVSDLRTAEQKQRGDRILLRFGAVDYEAKVWIDGHYCGGHRGGHVPFDLDVTDQLAPRGSESSSRRLTLRVFDSTSDLTQPRGKQYWGAKPESIFYTPSSGIWQSVWLEAVPVARIASSSYGTILRSDDIDGGKLAAKIVVSGRTVGQKYSVELASSIGGVRVSTSERKALPQEKDHALIDLNMRLSSKQLQDLPISITESAPLPDAHCWRSGVALWSPDHPLLYDLTLRLYDSTDTLIDTVKTTTGMRSLNWTTGDGSFRLNGAPIFQALLLDQGYWPDTFMTPPSQSALKDDIVMSKAMGFNGCRKHQKVEDPVFFYWADKLGFLVWGEMANAYEFNQDYVERFDQEWMESVRRDINHPCVVTWTPVNESWGYPDLKGSIEQRNHIRSLYYMTKTLDPTRSINDNCGWEHVHTDLTTFHDYSDHPTLSTICATLPSILADKGDRSIFLPAISQTVPDAGSTPLPGAPVMCTEFGGVNVETTRTVSADGDRQSDWGYTTAKDPRDLLDRVERLLMAVVEGGHCVGFVYTQLADIEQEVNGLYSYDRKPKLDVKEVRAILDKVQRTFRENHHAA